MSASANKLSHFKENAAEYASVVMHELDPDHKGYIEVTVHFVSGHLHSW